jgi:hypothetical protein
LNALGSGGVTTQPLTVNEKTPLSCVVICLEWKPSEESVMLGDSPWAWSPSQDRAWRMLGIGPCWVRQSIETGAQSANFDQAAMIGAFNRGLTARMFQWPNQCYEAQEVLKRGPDSWLLLSQTQSESPAQAEHLLDAMLSAISATWSKPEYPGGPEPLKAIRVLESGQVGGVLVLGREALVTLGHEGSRLEDLRGRAHPLLIGELQIPVIVSFAPQHLLNEPLDKARAWRDLQLARSLQVQGACFPIIETESNLA